MFCPLLWCSSLKGLQEEFTVPKKQKYFLLLPMFNHTRITKDYTPTNCHFYHEKNDMSVQYTPETHTLPATWDQLPLISCLVFYETVSIT